MSTRQDMLQKIINNVLEIAKKENKFSAFTIANTRKVGTGNMYFPPIRNTEKITSGVVVVYNSESVKDICSLIDGVVDIVFVDVEKKISPELFKHKDAGNIENIVFDNIKKSEVFTIKSNDLTVDSIDVFISHRFGGRLSQKKIAIIGAGNIGSKLALKLVERGCHVNINRRNMERAKSIADALNYIKPLGTIAQVMPVEDPVKACYDADVLIGCTYGVPVINQTMVDVIAKNAFIVDVGKGSVFAAAVTYAKKLNIQIYRIPVIAGVEGAFAEILSTKDLIENRMNEVDIDGIHVISAGIMGSRGDIVVDNTRDIKCIYGVANGKGDWITELEDDMVEKLERLKKITGLDKK